MKYKALSKAKGWLVGQWKHSLAKDIWDSMTHLGRATLWVPVWFLCMLIAVVIIPPLTMILFPMADAAEKAIAVVYGWFFTD